MGPLGFLPNWLAPWRSLDEREAKRNRRKRPSRQSTNSSSSQSPRGVGDVEKSQSKREAAAADAATVGAERGATSPPTSPGDRGSSADRPPTEAAAAGPEAGAEGESAPYDPQAAAAEWIEGFETTDEAYRELEAARAKVRGCEVLEGNLRRRCRCYPPLPQRRAAPCL